MEPEFESDYISNIMPYSYEPKARGSESKESEINNSNNMETENKNHDNTSENNTQVHVKDW